MANNDNASNDGAGRTRRGSFTQQTFTSIFGARSNSFAGGAAPTAPFPSAINTGSPQDQRRRMSISTLGLSGTSPTQTSPFPFGARRGSVSTAGSDSLNESAIDDDDDPSRSTPTTPFARRMSFGAQALRRAQPNANPGTNGRTPSYTTSKPSALPTIPSGPRSAAALAAHEQTQTGSGSITPPQSQKQASTQSKPRIASDYPVSARTGEGSGFNWSEQLRSRAESSVSQNTRPSFSAVSPGGSKPIQAHDRTKSVSDLPVPPAAMPVSRTPPKPARKKPDAFQERILKGDFYMD
ncbi:hypothetical protein GLAREA_00253 [Glarea lozoyensis ATCC 20868]|uniref:Uncharacterized protein n=1 Tax=Glarea lozoyensis (strain ATCC 20868 / MF5171) TaxID=1116229 RepID=S3CTU3_GLAL2|nr:uncharacterized protein GLAREA_00253 [Glarea lozoyensis ATCC 20868]EPE29095.1 hypothetical protein GLAREA_00253 [Glarea lozoyensis ATCC 20868]